MRLTSAPVTSASASAFGSGWPYGLGWMTLIEVKPWPTLTLIVSLEAIFLSTFVMISQNRADGKRQVMAAAEWKSVQLEEKQNEQLLDLSRQILELTDAIHQLTVAHTGLGSGPGAGTHDPPSGS